MLPITPGLTVEEICGELRIGRDSFYRSINLLRKAGIEIDVTNSLDHRRLYSLPRPSFEFAKKVLG
jgi:predicted DNA-binding transcriptional regulator YafY